MADSRSVLREMPQTLRGTTYKTQIRHDETAMWK